ncbi:protein WEAK CHLOROPLAST MOVEMENT UNDER BLUE LIGHT 1-like [Impatiens glandulifera]|uniref:protein WEAK CHLOROPLAST MOVEMENT UNDER BLUE LIGHT 1-like n=1 Tax=Impatiens glandulifera TaxID=253017 RepID=UPI001FB087A4|nr:protein WEAK CHLOROPLAST MOVEMENT UNDER BLUE LIGHT 1-like [Impatiens glandulifera]
MLTLAFSQSHRDIVSISASQPFFSLDSRYPSLLGMEDVKNSQSSIIDDDDSFALAIEPPKDENEVSCQLETIEEESSSSMLDAFPKDEMLQSLDLPLSVSHLQINTSRSIQSPDKQDVTSGVPKLERCKSIIDTGTPIESVKAAVTKFGGIVDWKAHRAQTVERQKLMEQELLKTQEEIPIYKQQSKDAEEAKIKVVKELETTNRLIEELKLNLDTAKREEHQAKQDSELAKLRVEEIQKGIAGDVSFAAKAQLEVAQARHQTAVSDLAAVKSEIEVLLKDYQALETNRDLAVKKAEEAVSTSKEVERTIEELTIELISAKESLETVQAAHLEAEEQRIATEVVREQDNLNWEKELKQVEDELETLNNRISKSKDLKAKLNSSTAQLDNLKAQLGSYMESKLKQNHEGGNKTHENMDMGELKLNTQRVTAEVNCLKMAAASLNVEVEREKSELVSVKKREEEASKAVVSLEAELRRMNTQVANANSKGKEGKTEMVELPKLLQEATQEAEQAKSLAQSAREEFHRAKEEAEEAKLAASSMEAKLVAVQKEIEASRVSEKLAFAAIRALKESEWAAQGKDSSTAVMISLEEYYQLSKQAYGAEEEANIKITSAISEIETAKQSEEEALRKLEDVNLELSKQKENLYLTLHKADEAKEGKLGVEQELREWRNEQTRYRKCDKEPEGSPMRLMTTTKQNAGLVGSGTGTETDTDSSIEVKSAKKKKKSLIPRLFTFLAKKKSSKK